MAAVPPLTLTVLQLSPPSCIPSHPPTPPLTPVPAQPVDFPPLPAGFSVSPSPHYAGPFGLMSLGETFKVQVRLSNTSQAPVLGVKMMIECQGPNGRYRLGEIVHDDGQERGEGVEPELEVGGRIEMDVGSEMKDVGVNLLICSVAWETDSGRRTFQRFFKFEVTPPLSIKTRVHASSSPSILLDPHRRSDVHLEILVQNTSAAGLAFDKVVLEPVKGLLSRPTPGSEYKDLDNPDGMTMSTLFPNDTRQYLFTLFPDPDFEPSLTKEDDDDEASKPSEESRSRRKKSVFPPDYAVGTILPLGRLDLAWFSAPYRNSGRLQTSTLNRRVNVAAPHVQGQIRPIMPTKTSTALPPTPGGVPQLPNTPRRQDKDPVDVATATVGWEYDLVLLDVNRQVEVESRFEIILRVAARSPPINKDEDSPGPAPRPRLAIQYLSHPTPSTLPHTTAAATPTPTFALSPPSRSATPMSPLGRPFSPPGAAGPSRPTTPVSSQLRQATSSNIGQPTAQSRSSTVQLQQTALVPPSHISTAEFPPPPYLPSALSSKGQITHLGASLIPLDLGECEAVLENMGTTYVEASDRKERWEVVHEVALKFMALDDGLSELGGVRLLGLDDEVGMSGSTLKEWDTLGEVWVTA